MSITSEPELEGMRRVSEAVALTLKAMREHARPGMSARELDQFGGRMLQSMGARSAPALTYNFPGYTCICVNEEIAHGVPGAGKVFQEGDLVNIDVSAELDGFWADNGGSFVLGEDLNHHLALVDASRRILRMAIGQIRGGVRIADVGRLIEREAKRSGYRVIRNLAGHGVGSSLHEEPHEILNWFDHRNRQRFTANSVVAIETFISTDSSYATEAADGWTLVGNHGGFVAQHEHTLLVTREEPLVLTAANGW